MFFTDEFQKMHYAPFMSRSFIITYLMVLVAILLPFVLIVRTHSKWRSVLIVSPIDFWITDFEYYEQPKVSPLNEIIVFIYTEKSTYAFGSTSELNQLLNSDKSEAPLIKVSSQNSKRSSRAFYKHLRS